MGPSCTVEIKLSGKSMAVDQLASHIPELSGKRDVKYFPISPGSMYGIYLSTFTSYHKHQNINETMQVNILYTGWRFQIFLIPTWGNDPI